MPIVSFVITGPPPATIKKEVYHITSFDPISLVLLFERFPVWLPLIHPRWTRTLWFPKFSSCRDLSLWLIEHHMPINYITYLISQFTSDQLRWGVYPTLSSNIKLWMLSGSVDYLSQTARSLGSLPFVAVCDHHCPKPLRKGRPTGVPLQDISSCQWHRIRHETLGGATLYIGLLLTNVVDVTPSSSSLRRSLGDFLDYGARPITIQSPDSRDSPDFLHIRDLLSLDHLHHPVILPTHLSRTGWGSRFLTPAELGRIFGLPAPHFSPVDLDLSLSHFLGMVPLPILDSWFTPWSSHLPSVSPVPAPVIGFSPRRILPVLTATWIPSLRRFLPHSWIDATLVTSKAAKRDDAAAPTALWDERLRLLFPYPAWVYTSLRRFLLARSRRRLLSELLVYLRSTYGLDWQAALQAHRRSAPRHQGGWMDTSFSSLVHDVAQGCQVLYSFSGATWWDWDLGSTLVFWRWGSLAPLARDGMPPYLRPPMPRFRRRAPTPAPDKFPLYIPKLQTILSRRYVLPGPVKSLTQYFDVPKADDIRMVYNGSGCGLNKALWTPNFWLPTPSAAIRLLDFNYFSVDVDLGEMFLNYPLHSSLQPYSGIDVTPFASHLGLSNNRPCWLRWVRTWMGARPSPFMAVRFYYLADEFIRGNRHSPDNVFRWDTIKLNLPGSPTYSPDLPWVMKWNTSSKCIANDYIAFVDDLRITARTAEEAWYAGRIVTSRLQFLGNQDAARKRRPPTLTPGAWAGALFRVGPELISKSVTMEKWIKGRQLVSELCTDCQLFISSSIIKELTDPIYDKPLGLISYKKLEIARGFLVHLSMTFESTPFSSMRPACASVAIRVTEADKSRKFALHRASPDTAKRR